MPNVKMMLGTQRYQVRFDQLQLRPKVERPHMMHMKINSLIARFAAWMLSQELTPYRRPLAGPVPLADYHIASFDLLVDRHRWNWIDRSVCEPTEDRNRKQHQSNIAERET
jgi:hypothetical protein